MTSKRKKRRVSIGIRPPGGAQRFVKRGLRTNNPSRADLARGASISRGDVQDAVALRRFFDRMQGPYDKATARALATGRTLGQVVGWEPAIGSWWLSGGDPMRTLANRAIAQGRERNPIPVVGAAVVGAAVGGLVTYVTLGGQGNPVLYEEIYAYEGAVILVEKHDLVGEVIDDLTGGRGYSHVVLDLGWVDEAGDPVVVESVAFKGVCVQPLSDRPGVRIPLSAAETNYARGAAHAFLQRNTPYRGKRGGLQCAEFAVQCLPRSWRRGLPPDPTPNDLAAAWVVEG